ncbi:DUF6233 domain-containing protein [Streptomyces sp. NPDC057257]|uniref:DUF6233 domain-containing protein n=1 Tax=Streptomyces sp. NPDC057257 TaxID=3346071 RepID=UPI00364454D1
MDELPPDPARLRAILQYLDRQIADNETVGTYLRLQRDAVRKALDHTAPPQPRPRRANGHLPKGATGLPSFAPTAGGGQAAGFVVERQPSAVGREPVRIHVNDCSSAVNPLPVSAQDARAALLDPQVTACEFCRPDQELGMDLD